MPNYLTQEDTYKILQEDGFGILLEDQPSASASESASPSMGYNDYTRGDEATLPTTNTDLETAYTAQEVIDVSTDDGVRVGQTGTQQYMIHQFRNFFGSANGVFPTWNGQSSLAPSLSEVKLQIYNVISESWEDVASNNSANADTDFTITGYVPNLSDYRNGDLVVTFRIWQLAI